MPVWVYQIIFGAAITGIIGLLVWIVTTIQAMQRRMDISETKSAPLWTQVQEQLSRAVHHDDPAFKETDDLVDQLQMLTITLAGRTRLKELLAHRMEDLTVDEMERKKAKALIAVMDIVVIEKGGKQSVIGGAIIVFLFSATRFLTNVLHHIR
jgi:hypothetical protein